jgi:hypothetical protein
MDDELPPDPDLDSLPEELAEHPGPWRITASDEDGNVWAASVTREAIASTLADERRRHETDDA